jgi:hypothetical protein
VTLQWDPCVEHRASEAHAFVNRYFAQANRRAVLICAGGFDDRSAAFPVQLAQVMRSRLRVVALREERPAPQQTLVARAEQNIVQIQQACAQSPAIETVEVFGPDNAVVIGRKAIDAIRRVAFDDATDIVVDLSALSIGASFPIVRFLYEGVAKKTGKNLHVILVPAGSGGEPGDRELTGDMSCPHGFQGGLGTDESIDAPKLWVPHLGAGRRNALEIIHRKLEPDEIVPVLPFPCHPPRVGDELLAEFLDEIESAWEVDSRSLLYADDRHPLDLYRSISRLSASRQATFGSIHKSFVILTPLGSKALTLGALMAAMEHNLPVRYVETLSYVPPALSVSPDLDGLTHIWLSGDVYP